MGRVQGCRQGNGGEGPNERGESLHSACNRKRVYATEGGRQGGRKAGWKTKWWRELVASSRVYTDKGILLVMASTIIVKFQGSNNGQNIVRLCMCLCVCAYARTCMHTEFRTLISMIQPAVWLQASRLPVLLKCHRVMRICYCSRN